MLDKKNIEDFKNKAKSAYQNVVNETNPGNSNTNNKNNSSFNHSQTANKDSDFIDNAAINKSVKFVIEKTLKQAENFIDKFFRPYDVHEILNDVYINYILSELIQKQKENPSNQIYCYEIVVLYLNKGDFKTAESFFKILTSSELITILKPVIELSKLSDRSFDLFYEKNMKAIRDARVYYYIKKYADRKFTSGQYIAAVKDLEIACTLNPTSPELHKKLSICYEELGKNQNSAIHNSIIGLLR